MTGQLVSYKKPYSDSADVTKTGWLVGASQSSAVSDIRSIWISHDSLSDSSSILLVQIKWFVYTYCFLLQTTFTI